MIAIDEHRIDALAANAKAIDRARELASSRSYRALRLSTDRTVLFGRCDDYECSVDFADPAMPVSRCSCPSGQSPCKHALGMLHVWCRDETRFAETELPADLAAERANAHERKATARSESARSSKPAKVDVRALGKKLRAQSDGLELLEKILGDVLLRGLGTYGTDEAFALRDRAAMLRAAWLPGVERALLRLSDLVVGAGAARPDGDGDPWREVMGELARLEALVREGRAYLSARLADPGHAPETSTAIMERLGHVWRHDELVRAGCAEPAAELVQLAFLAVDEPARRRHLDIGVWLRLGDGRLFHTETPRSYGSPGLDPSNDSDFEIACVPGFVRYPGESPVRIRWRERTGRVAEPSDAAVAGAVARTDFDALLKSARRSLGSPLRPRLPLVLVRPAAVGRSGKGAETRQAIEDGAGGRIELADASSSGLPPTTALLSMLGGEAVGATLLCLFHADPVTLRVAAQPLTVVRGGSIIRLAG